MYTGWHLFLRVFLLIIIILVVFVQIYITYVYFKLFQISYKKSQTKFRSEDIELPQANSPVDLSSTIEPTPETPTLKANQKRGKIVRILRQIVSIVLILIFAILIIVIISLGLVRAYPTRVTSQRIAIVGGGIAGLSAAWSLGKLGIHDITLFEESDLFGGAAATYYDNFTSLGVDLGFTVQGVL